MDENGDGKVSFVEYMMAMSISARGTLKEKLKWTFTIFDLNKNGFIEKSEMLKIIQAAAEYKNSVTAHLEQNIDRVEHMFLKLDANGDGHVSLDEFIEGCIKDENIRSICSVFP